MRATLFAAAFCLILAGGAAAQQQFSPDHSRAAAELVELLQLEKQTAAGFNTMTGQPGMLGDNPLADVVQEFVQEKLPWSKLQPEYVRLYAETFTEQELCELAAFYRTSLGQRVVETTPQLAAGVMEISQRLMMPHMGELQRRIMERLGGG
jgi:uncharacterized protein